MGRGERGGGEGVCAVLFFVPLLTTCGPIKEGRIIKHLLRFRISKDNVAPEPVVSRSDLLLLKRPWAVMPTQAAVPRSTRSTPKLKNQITHLVVSMGPSLRSPL